MVHVEILRRCASHRVGVGTHAKHCVMRRSVVAVDVWGVLNGGKRESSHSGSTAVVLVDHAASA